jgi:hypothetical protein
MTNSYLLSVVIPTRNRQYFATHAIRQVLSCTGEETQVVVQDNSDTDELREMIGQELHTGRVDYTHTSSPLSFSMNFDMAIGRARGAYVCIIGDDDGVLPTIVEVAAWAAKHGIQAVTPSLNAVYYWPGSVSGAREELNACVLDTGSSDRVHYIHPQAELDVLLARGGLDYMALDLVKIYHGLVARELLQVVKDRTGSFFGGLSPDIYSAVALSSFASLSVSIEWPITLPGTCRVSGGGQSAAGTHVGELTQAPHFRGTKDYEWSTEVPAFYSVETIWADSCLAALRDLGRVDLLNGFNHRLLRRVLARRYPDQVSTVPQMPGVAGHVEGYTRYRVALLARRVRRRAIALRRRPQRLCHLDNIELAVSQLTSRPEWTRFVELSRQALSNASLPEDPA